MSTNVSTTTADMTYYYTTWTLSVFLVLFYAAIITSTYPYTRNRIPLFWFVLFIFLPPAFMIMLLYLLLLICLFTPPPVETREIQIVEVNNKTRRPKSRDAIRNGV